jgi:mRNA-degrading endonuclease RelE of RelBE toxin-antitoxin system
MASFNCKLNKIVERLINPREDYSKLRKMKYCYKMKLCAVWHRLNYRVEDKDMFVSEIAIGRRTKTKPTNLEKKDRDLILSVTIQDCS